MNTAKPNTNSTTSGSLFDGGLGTTTTSTNPTGGSLFGGGIGTTTTTSTNQIGGSGTICQLQVQILLVDSYLVED